MNTNITVQNFIDALDDNIDINGDDPLYYSTDGITVKALNMYLTDGYLNIFENSGGLCSTVMGIYKRLKEKKYLRDLSIAVDGQDLCYLSLCLRKIAGKWAILIEPEQDMEF
jgi:hypothetical protein